MTDSKPEVGFTLRYDDDAKRNVMTIQIPLEGIALDDPTKGMVTLWGWFKFCENEATAIVRMKKAALAKAEFEKSKILIPGAGMKQPLQVH